MNRLPANPLIKRALDVVEKKIGTEALCSRLGASEHLVRAWQLGHSMMPHNKFLQLADILTELDASWTEWDEVNPDR